MGILDLFRRNPTGFDPDPRLWKVADDGWLYYDDEVWIMGIPFHMMAIETTGEDEQRAAVSKHQADLVHIQKGGQTDAGYMEVELFGRPHVVFLVPNDRE